MLLNKRRLFTMTATLITVSPHILISHPALDTAQTILYIQFWLGKKYIFMATSREVSLVFFIHTGSVPETWYLFCVFIPFILLCLTFNQNQG